MVEARVCRVHRRQSTSELEAIRVSESLPFMVSQKCCAGWKRSDLPACLPACAWSYQEHHLVSLPVDSAASLST